VHAELCNSERMIRPADPSATPRPCAAIYAPHVRDGVASFESEPPGAVAMAQRIARLSARHAWLVDERDGRVAGHAPTALARQDEAGDGAPPASPV
jgi:phosphinothricin acetyltransferase